MASIDKTVRDIIGLVSDLQDDWHFEDGAACWPPRSDVPTVSGGGVCDPTFKTVDQAARTRHRDGIADTLEHVHRLLTKARERQHPVATGKPCRTRGCEGPGLFFGYCDRCDMWRRNNPGLDPADMNGLVADWNSRLPRFCECSTDCCPEGCHDERAPDRRLSHRCHKWQQRVRESQREAS